MPAIVIEVGAQGNGTTFRLSPQTKEMLQGQGQFAPVGTSFFVAHDPGINYGHLIDQVVPLLPIITGLPIPQPHRASSGAEQSTCNRQVSGSSPGLGARNAQ